MKDDDGVESIDAVRRYAYRWTRVELPDLVDRGGHPCMWAVAAAVQIIRRGDRVTVPMVRSLREDLMPDEYRLALADLALPALHEVGP